METEIVPQVETTLELALNRTIVGWKLGAVDRVIEIRYDSLNRTIVGWKRRS